MVVVIIYYYVGYKYRAPRPSEQPLVRGKKTLGGIKGCKYETCKYETSSVHGTFNGFPDGNNIGSTVYCRGEAHRSLYYTLTLIVMQGHQKTVKTEAM